MKTFRERYFERYGCYPSKVINTNEVCQIFDEAIKESSKVDFKTCLSRGKADGLSKETHCDH